MKKIKHPKNIKNKSFFKRENKKFYFFAGGMLVSISLKDEILFWTVEYGEEVPLQNCGFLVKKRKKSDFFLFYSKILFWKIAN